MTGTGMVTVAGVGAGVGDARVVAVAEAAADPVGAVAAAAVEPASPPAPARAEGILTISETTLRLSNAPASATPPTVRNCRLVAAADRTFSCWA